MKKKDRKEICSLAYYVSGFLPQCLLLLRAVGSPACAVPRGGDRAEQVAHCCSGATLAPGRELCCAALGRLEWCQAPSGMGTSVFCSAVRPKAGKIGETVKFSCLRVVYQCPLETVAASLEESLFLPVTAMLKITYQELA